MPKVGVKQDQKRRAKAAAKPAPKPATPKTKAGRAKPSPKSPLAEYLLDPTEAKKSRLMSLAQAGGLTVADIQSALAQELSTIVGLAEKPPAVIAALRPLFVLRHRLLKDLQEVVLKSKASADFSNAAIWQVTVTIRSEGAGRGDQVRTVAPPEEEWPR